MVLRSDVPVRVPDLGVDPGRARRRCGLDITWRFFSLEEVNRVDGKKHPWERPWSYGWGQMRVGSLIRRELGNDELDRWYAAVGSAFFNDGVKTHVPETHAEVLRANGFDPTLVERAIADPATIDDVRADHDHAALAYGAHGVPTIVFAVGRPGLRTRRRARADRAPTRSRCWELVRVDAALPAPVRAPASEDARRSRARRRAVRDLPHDARLEHRRESRAVGNRLSSARLGRFRDRDDPQQLTARRR